MKKIGVVYGTENTFPPALLDRINSFAASDVAAEHIKIGGVRMAEPTGYRVIIDRISHDIPFYRSFLKNAMLNGTSVINNPFWWSADDKFFNYSIASKLGVAIPRTVLLPHKQHPPGTTDKSMRNLQYPLDWNDIFRYVGFPAFLKPHSWGRQQDVHKVDNEQDFFRAYDETGDLCMTLQAAVNFDQCFRCYVVGREKVHVMAYDPREQRANRYVRKPGWVDPNLYKRMVNDALTLCRALGYDLNMVEFAVEAGVPYAIDFMNPVPDTDYYSVGPEHFDWIVNNVAEFAVKCALSDQSSARDLRWSAFLTGK